MSRDLSLLETNLGHSFANRRLLEEALTHPSLDQAHRPTAKDYDRLEFLGDRVLGVIVAAELCYRFPIAKSGELALRYNATVRRESLADIARYLGLGDWLFMAKSEKASGGADKPAVLADILEAVIAAIYLDGGFSASETFVLKHFAAILASEESSRKDSKTALQEFAHSHGFGQPVYKVIAQSGPAHEPDFLILVSVEKGGSAEAAGRSKRDAEQDAAAALLKKLEIKT